MPSKMQPQIHTQMALRLTSVRRRRCGLRNLAALPAFALLLLLTGCERASAGDVAVTLPRAAVDSAPARPGELQSTVFAGGCFWGIQAVFQHVKGVRSATSGYAGGNAVDAHYDIVSTGNTGHAESVQVVFDPAQVSYGRLLQIFFSVAHDPTELNRQGPDSGTQYRSALFTATADQQRIARTYIAQLQGAKLFRAPIVTKVSSLAKFYPAERYHQDYASIHPDSPYIAINDAPKVEQLRVHFAELYRDKPVLISR